MTRRAIPLERDIQAAILGFVRRCVVGGWAFHVPNATGGSKSNVKAHLFRRAKEGVVSGVPDLCVMWPGGLLWLEVKRPGGVVSDQQRHVHALLRDLGQRVAVVHGIDEAEAALREAGATVRVSDAMRGAIGRSAAA